MLSIRRLWKRFKFMKHINFMMVFEYADLYKPIEKKFLFRMSKKKYGDKYSRDLLEQYKMYVELFSQSSALQQQSESLFLSVNIAVIGALGYTIIQVDSSFDEYIFITILLIIISLLTMVFCVLWIMKVKLHQIDHFRRFRIIYSIEMKLPLSIYHAEMKLAGSDRFRPYYILAKLTSLFHFSFVFIYLVIFVHALVNLILL